MKPNNDIFSIFSRLRHGQRGQTIALMIVCLIALVGMTGFVIDIGHLYFADQELQAATQASALAAGAVLDQSGETAGEVTAEATKYSAVAGNENAEGNLPNVTMVSGYPKLECLTTLTNEGILCSASPAGNYNAVVVSQQAVVPTTFARVFGFKSWTITATATASAQGGPGGPYNVEIILDTTASMNDDDLDSNCDNTRLHCALAGIQVLLNTLSPCPPTAAGTTCGAASTETPTVGANVANPVDEAGLMVFGGLKSTALVPDDYACPADLPAGSVQYYNAAPVYQIIPFSSDYRTSDSAASLNTSSDFVKAVGGATSCSQGVDAPGGVGTFYAGVIDAAQAALVANKRTNTQNVMILLSDGDANPTSADMNGPAGTTTTTSYPATNPCHQAITEAAKAAAAGTEVYTVAYGAEASGCTNDSPAITPCQTMQQIASSSKYFFSDYTATGSGGCVGSASSTTTLNGIFKEIGNNLTVSRLIPNGTT
jgi:Putative Flp pilus-assembly TadE/G-like